MCEPIVPFMRVAAGPAFIMESAIVLPIAVGLKSLLFARLQRHLRYWTAVTFMVAGNLLTTVVGAVAAAMLGSAGLWLAGIPIVWALCWFPAKRAIAISDRRWLKAFSPGLLAAMMTGALVLSCILFLAGQGAILANRFGLYWTIKFAAVYLALLVSILLSAFWEEWVVWALARIPERQNFGAAALRANLYVLLLIMIFAAAIMVPKRLERPDLLVRRQPAQTTPLESARAHLPQERQSRLRR
jgi:hypothetical protein